MAHLASLEVECSGVSLTGPVRPDNQDTILLADFQQDPPGQGLLYAVADGMGGYAHGAVASALALSKLCQVLNQESAHPSAQNLRRGVEAANLWVYQASQHLGAGKMGTTLTAAWIFGERLHLAHVGDSRAYLVREKKATCLTQDHTTVGEMVRMRILPPDKVRTHAQRSILTKAVGLALFIQPDITALRLQESDRLILCSDGVWSVIEDDEFARLSTEAPSAQALSQNLIDLAIHRQTDDNASAVIIHIRKLPAHPTSLTHSKNRFWPRLLSWIGIRD